jgi:hypothetical protein
MKKLICFLLTSSILYSCAEVETPNIQVVGYKNNNVTVQTNKTTNTKKKQSSNISNKTTASKTTQDSTISKETVKEETKTNESNTSNLSLAQKILLKSKQNYDTLKNYSATFNMYSKRNDKTVPKGRPVLSTETKYIFQPPRNSAFDVVKHNLSLVVGAKMVWKGGTTAKVKASGVLGLFPLDLSLDDDKMTTNRNWRLDHLDHVGILSRALDEKAQVELIGKTEINGKQAYMIQVKGTGLDSEVTHENIAIDMKDFFIIADEMYSDKDLLFQLKINIESKNINLPEKTFEV